MPDNTADAVVSGALYAAAGAVERFAQVATQRLGACPALFLTGGGSEDLVELLPSARRVHDLVLDGLVLWAAVPASHR